jgi:hypothetical protein
MTPEQERIAQLEAANAVLVRAEQAAREDAARVRCPIVDSLNRAGQTFGLAIRILEDYIVSRDQSTEDLRVAVQTLKQGIRELEVTSCRCA